MHVGLHAVGWGLSRCAIALDQDVAPRPDLQPMIGLLYAHLDHSPRGRGQASSRCDGCRRTVRRRPSAGGRGRDLGQTVVDGSSGPRKRGFRVVLCGVAVLH